MIFMVCTIISCRNTAADIPSKPPVHWHILDSANRLLNAGEVRKSVFYLDSAFARIPDPSSYDLWKRHNFRYNYYLNYEKDTEKAMLCLDSMFSVLAGKERIYKSEYAATLYSRGDALVARKKFAEAYEAYYQGKEFAEKELDSCSWSLLSSKMAMVCYRKADFRRAVFFFRQAFDESRHCTDREDFEMVYIYPQAALNAMALSFEHLDQLDSAVIYYRKALDFILTEGEGFPERRQYVETAKGVVLGNLGGTLARQKKYGQAEHYLRESIDINSRPGYAREDAITAEAKLAGLLLELDREAEALTLIHRIDTSLSSGEMQMYSERMLLRLHELYTRYYRKMQQNDLANHHELVYYRLRDSLDAEEKGLRMVDVDEGLEAIERKYRLRLLDKNNQLQTLIIICTLIFLTLVVYILLAVMKNLRQSKKDVGTLTSMNQKISEQNITLQKTLAALAQSQGENTRIMKIVAHDLRNPVGGIGMIASMMLEKQEMPAEDRASLEMIRDASSSSMELIRQLLQIQPGGEDLQTEQVELHALLYKCVAFLNLKAAEKHQYIRLTTDQVVLQLNQEKILRLMNNLITNALKFSPSHTEVRVDMKKNGKHVRISVEDQGMGIPDSMKDKLFEMHTDTRRRGTAGEETFGMGLAISKQIVQSHNGRIWFENKPGGGAVFFVEIPIR